MLQALADNKLSTHSLVPPTLVSNTGLEKQSATQKDCKEEVRKDSCSAYQVRIGPVAFEGCGDFANDQVVHLLGGLWVVSGEAKSLVCHSEHARHGHLHTRAQKKIDAWMARAIWPRLFYLLPRSKTTSLNLLGL